MHLLFHFCNFLWPQTTVWSTVMQIHATNMIHIRLEDQWSFFSLKHITFIETPVSQLLKVFYNHCLNLHVYIMISLEPTEWSSFNI